MSEISELRGLQLDLGLQSRITCQADSGREGAVLRLFVGRHRLGRVVLFHRCCVAPRGYLWERAMQSAHIVLYFSHLAFGVMSSLR